MNNTTDFRYALATSVRRYASSLLGLDFLAYSARVHISQNNQLSE